jgi:hypothetical protein
MISAIAAASLPAAGSIARKPSRKLSKSFGIPGGDHEGAKRLPRSQASMSGEVPVNSPEFLHTIRDTGHQAMRQPLKDQCPLILALLRFPETLEVALICTQVLRSTPYAANQASLSGKIVGGLFLAVRRKIFFQCPSNDVRFSGTSCAGTFLQALGNSLRDAYGNTLGRHVLPWSGCQTVCHRCLTGERG